MLLDIMGLKTAGEINKGEAPVAKVEKPTGAHRPIFALTELLSTMPCCLRIGELRSLNRGMNSKSFCDITRLGGETELGLDPQSLASDPDGEQSTDVYKCRKTSIETFYFFLRRVLCVLPSHKEQT